MSEEIKTIYCGSLFVGHCTADDLDHFDHFVKELDLDVEYLLNIGMDGPNVNKKYEQLLESHLGKEKKTTFIKIGSCNLHAVNNSFGNGLKSLKEDIIDLDQFAIDLHFFFKLSAARREDCSKTSEITDITAIYMLKHCTMRWLSIELVLVRIIEQYTNLNEYFLKILPKQKNFKKDIANTARYKRIVNILKCETSLPFMTFVVYTTSEFRDFMLTFQTDAPMIHILHSKMMSLFKSQVHR